MSRTQTVMAWDRQRIISPDKRATIIITVKKRHSFLSVSFILTIFVHSSNKGTGHVG